MKILSNYNHKQQTPNFKKGLTSAEINTVKKMSSSEYIDIAQKLKNIYNIDAEFSGCNTVAWCVEQVVDIMTRAGFRLPKQFIFAPLNQIFPDAPLGVFIKEENLICINADYPEFTDLRAQNELEESQRNHHPTTKHFLHSYLHEFSHAAHFNNLCSKYGEEQSIKKFEGDLHNYSPDEVIVGPMNALIRDKVPGFFDKIVNALIPPANGLYALKNLKEYFAEKNAKRIAAMLGDNYYPSMVKNIASEYQTHPYNWDVFAEFKKILIPPNQSIFALLEKDTDFHDTAKMIYDSIKLFNQDIKYTDGDIFHGTIDPYRRMSHFNRHW